MSKFGPNKKAKDGRQSWCRACTNEKVREWQDRNRDKVRIRRKEWKYGLPSGTYLELMEQQNGLCAICRQVCPVWSDLSIDHDHVSGSVRGLLCVSCNGGLGLFHDNPNTLRSAIEYLENQRIK